MREQMHAMAIQEGKTDNEEEAAHLLQPVKQLSDALAVQEQHSASLKTDYQASKPLAVNAMQQSMTSRATAYAAN